MAIDPDQRRQEIARITIDLIAREGLAAATIRRIAAEAGGSTATITHYFDDKRDLLLRAFEVLSREGEERFEAAFDGTPATTLDALMTMVPWCPVNVRRWKAYLAFWDAAMRDGELAAMLAQSTATGTRFLTALLLPLLPATVDPEKAADRLSTVVQGLALQVLVDPARWDVARIRETLADALEDLARAGEPACR